MAVRRAPNSQSAALTASDRAITGALVVSGRSGMMLCAVVLGAAGCVMLVGQASAAAGKTGQYVVLLVKLSVRPQAQYGRDQFLRRSRLLPGAGDAVGAGAAGTICLASKPDARPCQGRRDHQRPSHPLRSALRYERCPWFGRRREADPRGRYCRRPARRARPSSSASATWRSGDIRSPPRSCRIRRTVRSDASIRGIRHRPRRAGGGTGANRR
jgi:hypothetical protein